VTVAPAGQRQQKIFPRAYVIGRLRASTQERMEAQEEHTGEHGDAYHGADEGLALSDPVRDAGRKVHAPGPRPGGHSTWTGYRANG
jgi:hypothetical protein